jgi:hypothetical protein
MYSHISLSTSCMTILMPSPSARLPCRASSRSSTFTRDTDPEIVEPGRTGAGVVFDKALMALMFGLYMKK